MTLPEFPELSSKVVNALLSQHGLASQPAVRLPDVGIFNAIFAVGENLVLRIPRNHPAFIEAAHKEAVAVPFARRAGVRTPDLLIFDDSLELLPVPYSFYERVQGETLELLGLEPKATQAAYFELGRDLALLHQGVPFIEPARSLELEGLPEPEALPDELAAEGYIGTSEARWLLGWLAHLRSLMLEQRAVFRHGDVQATNVMVGSECAYLSLLDWGACGWGEAADDFAGIPLRAVPFMLDGYCDVYPGVDNVPFLARILYRHLHLALFLVRRPPQPGKAWAERPLGMVLEVMRFLMSTRDERWKRLWVEGWS